MTDVLDEVKTIVARQMSAAKQDLTAETELRELGFESFDVVELMFLLEENFHIDLPFNDPTVGATLEFRTIGDIAQAITTALAKTPADYPLTSEANQDVICL